MKKGLKMTIPLLLSLLLASCIETQELEELAVINARGIDIEENLLEATLVAFQFSAQSGESTKIISGKGKTVDGAMEDAEHASVFKLAPGKIKLSLYGKDMAEKGILPLLDSQARDARLPDLMYLAVSETTAKEILSVDEKKLSSNVGQFLHGLIENHSTDHNVPRKTLQDFLRIYYDVGQDNVLPLFEIQNDTPKLSGIALFQADKMIAKLSNEETVLINLMDRVVKERMIELSLPIEPFKEYLETRENGNQRKGVESVFLIKKGHSKTKLIDEENLVFETNTEMELRLLEQSAGIVLDNPQVIETLEKEVKKKMETRFEKFLTKLQTLNSDPFGYGRYYKRSQAGKNLTNEEWREKFPTIEVKFNVDVEIFQHGVTD